MTFSERMGLKKPKIELQKEEIDKDLLNSLWSCLILNILEKLDDYHSYIEDQTPYHNKEHLIEQLWLNFFKSPIDRRPQSKDDFVRIIRKWFFDDAEWNEVYDFIEFIIGNHKNQKQVGKFIGEINLVLKRELSAYRVVSLKITPITSNIDKLEIEKAIDSPIQEIREHLNRALELLSDRKNPDYRNSIKESISAVETICKKISENPRADLGDALTELVKSGKIKFHGAIQTAFKNLYGYTSDADGIRHSLMEEESLDQEDALFMLVSCSAFVNYLTVKTLKSGNNLSKL